MTTEPYVPDWTDLRDRYAFHASVHTGASVEEARREAERAIRKIKADALREFADELEANLTITSGPDDALTIGVLRERADEIEGEA